MGDLKAIRLLQVYIQIPWLTNIKWMNIICAGLGFFRFGLKKNSKGPTFEGSLVNSTLMEY